ncbi:cyanophycin synthetase [Paenibacillus sp. PK3_47]|uniref:cyanophycin synthetase family protein n=1 Tax=Paenibacillus sp. PK3_47 TaxID=2072642 RepID=UPI00201E1750|nr:cyanophycin synthetase [Paenibacillus sp. PK3_47]
MKVNKIKFLSGPNLYSFKPTLWIELDIEELEDKPSNELPGFTERLLKAIPSLQTHTCSRGYPGGFVERLQEGTWMGHILEHMALEIQHLAGIPVKRGKTITGEQPGIYYVTFDYKEPESGRYAFEAALDIAEGLLSGRTVDAAPYIEKTSGLYYANKLGPSTEAIYEAALARKIPAERIGPDSTLRLGTGSKQKSVQATISSQTSYLAVELSCDKEMTKLLLEQAGLPVPEGLVIDNRDALLEAAEELGYPLVLKPLNGRQGQAVLTNLQTSGQLEKAYAFARKEFSEYDMYIVERFFPGRDYRFTVVGGKLAAASLRQPPYVTGDGRSTIGELIALENRTPLRGKGHEKPMTEIPPEQAECYLGKMGLALADIPAAGLRIQVIGNANLSTGGSSEDVTAKVHPSYAELAVRAAGAIGLDIAGVDIISDNIAEPYRTGHGCILEVNAAPGIRMHQHPSQGEPRDVGGAIVDYLFADRSQAAVPLAAVTGTNGKTTTVRLLAHLLQQQDRRVGMTCSDGIWIGGTCVEQGDCSGPKSARKVLARQDVDAAVLETARGGIMREGLAFRWCNVGVVTNVSEDHLGQDGLNTLEDLPRLNGRCPRPFCPAVHAS